MKAEMLRMYEDCKREGAIVEVGSKDRTEHNKSVDVLGRPTEKNHTRSFNVPRSLGRNTLAPPPATAEDVISVKRDNLREPHANKDKHVISFADGSNARKARGERVLESPPHQTTCLDFATHTHTKRGSVCQQEGDAVSATTPIRTSLELSRNSQNSSTASSCTTVPHADTCISPQHTPVHIEALKDNTDAAPSLAERVREGRKKKKQEESGDKRSAADCDRIDSNVRGANIGGGGGGGGRLLWLGWLRTACRKFYMPRRIPK